MSLWRPHSCQMCDWLRSDAPHFSETKKAMSLVLHWNSRISRSWALLQLDPQLITQQPHRPLTQTLRPEFRAGTRIPALRRCWQLSWQCSSSGDCRCHTYRLKWAQKHRIKRTHPPCSDPYRPRLPSQVSPVTSKPWHFIYRGFNSEYSPPRHSKSMAGLC